MIEIRNAGQQLAGTNYWTLPHAARGLCYLTANAGALRLLVPDAAPGYLAEMRTAKRVLIEDSMSAPGQCYDLVFDDGTASPFCVALDRRQCDRPLTAGRDVPLLVYTPAGLQLQLLAEIRL